MEGKYLIYVGDKAESDLIELNTIFNIKEKADLSKENGELPEGIKIIDEILKFNYISELILIYRIKVEIGEDEYLLKRGDFTLYNNKLVVLKERNLRTAVLRVYYNSILIIYFGRNKIRKVVLI